MIERTASHTRRNLECGRTTYQGLALWLSISVFLAQASLMRRSSLGSYTGDVSQSDGLSSVSTNEVALVLFPEAAPSSDVFCRMRRIDSRVLFMDDRRRVALNNLDALSPLSRGVSSSECSSLGRTNRMDPRGAASFGHIFADE